MKYLTKQSRLIMDVMARSEGHMTADEVVCEARKVMPKIALGTVYRNLSELCEMGALRRICVANAPDRFDRTLTPHEHIICPVCGRTEDLWVEGLGACLKSALEDRAFSYELQVHALCSFCRKAQKGDVGTSFRHSQADDNSPLSGVS